MLNAAPSSPTTGKLQDFLRTTTCPACAYHVAVSFYDGETQPLTTLAWPASSDAAQAMKRLPLDFVQCIDCGHVYNTRFDYDEVPYSDKPNLMYNKGALWQDYLQMIQHRILERLPESPVVVEIGCGDGHLLRSLADKCPSGRFIGFDLNAAMDDGGGKIEVYNEYFDPAVHFETLRPDLVISRHVLEHLMNPLGFVQSMEFAATWLGLDVQLFIEVPCIDRTFSTLRTVDFFYEHNSHFTSTSLERMLARSASAVDLVERGYNNEVVYGFARLGGKPNQTRVAQEALAFFNQANDAKATICQQLDALALSGQRIAFWGGTGKAAAFINRYQADAARFPCVVDSDADKIGTYVPGMGQEIRFPTVLIDEPVDTIIITTQWRASDIVLEITQREIPYQTILIEHQGRLIDYFKEAHPYSLTSV